MSALYCMTDTAFADYTLAAERGELTESGLAALAWATAARLARMERHWRTYQRQHPGPAFAPTIEQLPFYDVENVQLALL